ncbi:HD-GYP domain-containing protein [Roseimaritima sediminicola]|uniref:HD-GYP domain-containing protein n=1 Tax=Roseimaritima sediminicola TaxID=2662066 RepID=UPI001298300D|nr:HD domain-containing phosphohydrolase [Roseimaritima sediminicola]
MTAATISSFIPISVSTLVPSLATGLNLFLPSEDHDRLTLYRGDEYPLSDQDVAKLRDRGVTSLFIQQQDRERYQSYLRELAFESSDDEAVSTAVRAQALSAVVRDILAEAFDRQDTNTVVAAATQLGAFTAEIICEDSFAAKDMSRVLSHDYATFTHSTNVAMYAGILAKELGYNQTEIQQITTGGLLHDLGKLEIDDRILCKPGRLDEAEFREVKRHSLLGFLQLAHRDDLTEGQLMMVYQHHERCDGGGYPVGLVDAEIHPWAKLCTVVDVFEALTSHRPYRTPMPKLRALELLQRDSGKAFEPEVLACWVEITRNCWHD